MQQPMAARYIAAALALFLLSAPAHASKVIFLNSGSGSDSGTCGSPTGAACKTLQQAVNNAASGDTLYLVVAGDYGAATIDKSLTVQGVTGAGVFAPSNVPCLTISAGPKDQVTIREFTCIQGSVESGIFFHRGAFLLLENVIIDANSDFGLYGVLFKPTVAAELSIHDSRITNFSEGVRIQTAAALSVSAYLKNISVDLGTEGVACQATTGKVQVIVSGSTFTRTFKGLTSSGSASHLYMQDSVIQRSSVALEHDGGELISLGGNSFVDDDHTGTFTDTVGPK